MIRGNSRLEDAGGERPLQTRWVVMGDLRLRTAVHLGTVEGGAADLTLLRDLVDGSPLLTGASLAGALRGHLGDGLGGYHSREDQRTAELFGAAREDDQGRQSPLILFDSRGRLPRDRTEIRDGVAIAAARGTAEERKKFDWELAPAGTIFPIRVDILIADTTTEAGLLGLLVRALDGLAPGEIHLGARRSRGLGAVEVENWRARRFDLKTGPGWLDWLTRDAENPVGKPPAATLREALCEQLPSLALPAPGEASRRSRVVVEADLNFKGGLLVRSPAAVADAPDVAHLQSADESVLPGTSLAGVLRARAERIALCFHSKEVAEQWVASLFGPRLDEGRDDRRAARASRLRISESRVKGGERMRPARIRIDRFTQGVARGGLFDEEPHYNGRTRVRMELRNPGEGDVGLLLLLLKDLLAGHVAVGGASSIGRGVVRGAAALHLADGRTLALDAASELTAEDARHLDACVTRFCSGAPDESGTP